MVKITIDRVNLYRVNGAWWYSAWIVDEYDHHDTLVDANTEAEARAEIAALWPDARIARIADVEG